MVLLQRRAAALFLFAFIFLMPISHAHSREKTDIKTLVIVSHPYPERSVLTKGLQEAAESLEGVTVRNLETLYGYDTRRINGDAERKMMREHRRVVFIFPTHWFNITPMMKAWLNETWGSVACQAHVAAKHDSLWFQVFAVRAADAPRNVFVQLFAQLAANIVGFKTG